jgi:hypothetical protein
VRSLGCRMQERRMRVSTWVCVWSRGDYEDDEEVEKEGGISSVEEGGISSVEEGGISSVEEGGISSAEEGVMPPAEEGGIPSAGEGGIPSAGEGGIPSAERVLSCRSRRMDTYRSGRILEF